MVLADLGVAAVIVIGLAIAAAIIARQQYQRLHPPPTTEQITARLEEELAEADRRIAELKEEEQ